MSRPGAGAAYEAARIRFELGEVVRRRREELGLTQAELAERAGLKQPAVARFEAGGTMPTIPMLCRRALNTGSGPYLVIVTTPCEPHAVRSTRLRSRSKAARP
ncbi:helix-turn-helix domain-containing protein [Sphaerimonospora thailandensis]|nr:helix-turn-helix transcriptional regulator [Sphaerimonospora thailandensis]